MRTEEGFMFRGAEYTTDGRFYIMDGAFMIRAKQGAGIVGEADWGNVFEAGAG
jgi:hypothetical protein